MTPSQIYTSFGSPLPKNPPRFSHSLHSLYRFLLPAVANLVISILLPFSILHSSHKAVYTVISILIPVLFTAFPDIVPLYSHWLRLEIIIFYIYLALKHTLCFSPEP